MYVVSNGITVPYVRNRGTVPYVRPHVSRPWVAEATEHAASRFQKFDITMIKNENPGGTEDGSAQIRGHYIRGHVEGVVYQLANKMQMGFSPMDMLYQAGHSESTFETSYSRPLVPR